jgi:hypothetical protein
MLVQDGFLYLIVTRHKLAVQLCRLQNFLLTRALLNLLRKGLGRSKPAKPQPSHINSTPARLVEIPTISKLPELPSIE